MFYSYRRDAKNTKDHFFFASRQLYNFNADRFSFAVLSTAKEKTSDSASSASLTSVASGR
jgi:hypothetical protein